MMKFREFCVVVDGIGYASGYDAPPFVGRIVDDPMRADVFTDKRARYIAGLIRDEYQRLGCPKTAELVRIRARVVNIDRTGWHTPQSIGA